MQCFILMGGMGTRVASLTQGRPKALLPIGEEPFLSLQLKWLKRLGVTDVVLLVGHGASEIFRFLKDKESNPELPRIRFCEDGETLQGTGGALRNALHLANEDFFVTYGDSFLPIDLHRFMAFHLERPENFSMSVFKNHDSGDRSNVECLASGGIFYSKKTRTPAMHYIDYGLLALNRRAFADKAPREGAFDLADFLTNMSTSKDLSGFEVHTPFFEIGSVDGYQRFNKYMESIDFDLSRMQEDYSRT